MLRNFYINFYKTCNTNKNLVPLKCILPPKPQNPASGRYSPLPETNALRYACVCLCHESPSRAVCLKPVCLPPLPAGPSNRRKLKKPRIPATKKVTKLMMMRLSMTNPLTKAMMMMTKEGMNCLNSKSIEAVIFVPRIVVTAAHFTATACGEIDHEYFRAEGHLSCFIPGPLPWGALGCCSPPKFFVPRKICFKQIIKTKMLRPRKCILSSKPKNLATSLSSSWSEVSLTKRLLLLQPFKCPILKDKKQVQCKQVCDIYSTQQTASTA